MWLEDIGTSEQEVAVSEDTINKEKIYNYSVEEKFYLVAARNCVRFYLGNRRNVLNSPKHSSFKAFLSLPESDAKRSNVWRWYLATGGHPPYDPSKQY